VYKRQGRTEQSKSRLRAGQSDFFDDVHGSRQLFPSEERKFFPDCNGDGK
jgi:hypothetical protein